MNSYLRALIAAPAAFQRTSTGTKPAFCGLACRSFGARWSLLGIARSRASASKPAYFPESRLCGLGAPEGCAAQILGRKARYLTPERYLPVCQCLNPSCCGGYLALKHGHSRNGARDLCFQKVQVVSCH